jgi:predicted RNA-binding Zn-ribbon protein involved in translation (DUF1610 family)
MHLKVSKISQLTYKTDWQICLICEFMLKEKESGWSCVLCGADVARVEHSRRKLFTITTRRESFGVPTLVASALKLGGLDIALELFKDYA